MGETDRVAWSLRVRAMSAGPNGAEPTMNRAVTFALLRNLTISIHPSGLDYMDQEAGFKNHSHMY